MEGKVIKKRPEEEIKSLLALAHLATPLNILNETRNNQNTKIEMNQIDYAVYSKVCHVVYRLLRRTKKEEATRYHIFATYSKSPEVKNNFRFMTWGFLIKNGYNIILKKILTWFEKDHIHFDMNDQKTQQAVHCAIKRGFLETLVVLETNGTFFKTAELEEAIKHNKIKIVRFFYSHTQWQYKQINQMRLKETHPWRYISTLTFDHYTLLYVCQCGSLEVFKLFYKEYKIKVEKAHFDKLIENKRITIIEYLVAQGETVPNHISTLALFDGNLEGVKYYLEKLHMQIASHGLQYIYCNKQIKLARYLYETHKLVPDDKTIRKMYKYGYLEMVIFLCEEAKVLKPITEDLFYVVERGHLPIVRYFCESLLLKPDLFTMQFTTNKDILAYIHQHAKNLDSDNLFSLFDK